nr:MAG TPA: putative AtpZ [Caudoviricetes sp.]
MEEFIVLTLLFLFLVATAGFFVWWWIKIHETYQQPSLLVDLKNWLVNKLRG